MFFTTSLLLTGCAHFKSQPLAPEKSAAQFDSRRLDDPGLRKFLGQNLGHELTGWPLPSWDLPTLTLAAFYYQPSLEVARAQWRVAQAGIKTAGGRPNPTLSLVPGYDTTSHSPVNPWFPAVSFDLPIETAGKRGTRIAEASHLSESARWDIVTAAWKVRDDVRNSLLDFSAAGRRAALLEKQFAAQSQIVKLLQQRLDAGAISRPEFTTVQIAMNKTQIDFNDAQSKQSAARSRLAESLGISAAALEGVKFQFDFSALPADELTSAGARRAALLGRADILGALAGYAATEDDLRLQIAQQYPDVHLNPGYQFDQGDNKWSVGLTFDLPILNQNQGPIAEAKARCELSAANFTALQAQVIAGIDRAVTGWRVAEQQLKTGNDLLAAEQQQQKSVQAQIEAGAADQLDSLNAQLEFASASLVQLENETQLQQALGQLEDAVQSPLTLSGSVIRQTQTKPGETKPILKNEP
jgi:outer membrane protein, heavy metal efflux system